MPLLQRAVLSGNNPIGNSDGSYSSGSLTGPTISTNITTNYSIPLVSGRLASTYTIGSNSANNIVTMPDFRTVKQNFQPLIIINYANSFSVNTSFILKFNSGFPAIILQPGYTFIYYITDYTDQNGGIGGSPLIVPTFASNTHKAAVLACATENIDVTYTAAPGPLGLGYPATITGTTNGQFVIDGVSITLNRRFALPSQTAGLQNGIYVCTVQGDGSTLPVAIRPSDAQTHIDGSILPGMSFNVIAGNVNAGSDWYLTNTTPFSVNIDALIFAPKNAISTTAQVIVTPRITMNVASGTPVLVYTPPTGFTFKTTRILIEGNIALVGPGAQVSVGTTAGSNIDILSVTIVTPTLVAGQAMAPIAPNAVNTVVAAGVAINAVVAITEISGSFLLQLEGILNPV